jgi:hypothetical protein
MEGHSHLISKIKTSLFKEYEENLISFNGGVKIVLQEIQEVRLEPKKKSEQLT